jgi:ABC-type branched-subunit amino acid transport system substrate-binding protein
LFVTIVAWGATLGCHGTRKTLVPDVPKTGSAEARSRFVEAKAKFLEDGSQREEFKRIAEEFPNDPIVPWAELYAGIAAVKAHAFGDADKQLAKVLEAKSNEGVTAKAELYLGITKNYEGDAASARRLLAHADRAVENDEERTEYLAAVAYSLADGDKPLAALPVFDLLWPRVTPTEHAVLVARIEEIVAGASADALRRTYDELPDRRGASIAIVGSRLALIMEQDGDTAGAAKRREDIAPARVAVGLPKTITEQEAGGAKGARTGAGDPHLVGAVVPGAAKDKLVAEAVAAGLGLAAGAPDGKGVVAIETRPAADKAAAAEMVDALAHQDVIAIIGPIGDTSTDAAAGRAEGLGVPLITLTPHAEGRAGGRFIFHVRHSPEARARTLAERALAKGIKRFAVMGPDSDYGRGATTAFTTAVEKGGGTIVAKVLYSKDAKSFADQVDKLKDGWDGVFVADQASNLGLIAPTLAAKGAIPKALPFPKKVLGGRPVLLLATADDLTGELLVNAGRHVQGALLAPGFYPDDADPTIKAFVDRYTLAYGRPPGATAAYAYDAAQLAAAAGGGGRNGLAATLASGQLAGVTGAIKFDTDHHRADPGIVFTVVEETNSTFAVRVAH